MNQLPQKREEAIVVSKEIPGLISGYLEDYCDADIVVNSAPKSMKLNQAGKISASILSCAGINIQNECDEKFPNGISHGELAITSGYKLPYSLVFHCTVQDMTQENSFKEMAKLIRKCLETADGKSITKHDGNIKNVETIVFPLLGTGPKNLSPQICSIFYRTILAFCLGPTKSLKNAYIIVLPQNKHLINVIQDLNPFREFQQITHEMSYPYKWNNTENNFDVISLLRTSEEYQTIQENFLYQPPPNAKVLSIQRIQNKVLYKTYLQTRCQYKMTSKDAEKQIWISCQINDTNDLNMNGLNAEYITSSTYGEGYQFFDESNTADESIVHQSQNRTAYFCSVGAGQIINGKREYNENCIPKSANTAVDNIHRPSIYIIFDKNLFYPNYLVTYQVK